MQSLADSFIVGSPLRDFNLSQNKSLRTLQVRACAVNYVLENFPPDTASRLLRHVLSTIQSPAFFQVEIIYLESDLSEAGAPHGCRSYPYKMSEAEFLEKALQHHKLFDVFRKAHKVRGFRLVLCANVREPMKWCSMQVLNQVVATEKAIRGFGGLSSEPLVTYRPFRRPCHF